MCICGGVIMTILSCIIHDSSKLPLLALPLDRWTVVVFAILLPFVVFEMSIHIHEVCVCVCGCHLQVLEGKCSSKEGILTRYIEISGDILSTSAIFLGRYYISREMWGKHNEVMNGMFRRWENNRDFLCLIMRRD